jgi:lipopolysaccharide transport system ATP-binding protein
VTYDATIRPAVEVNHLWKRFHRGEIHDSLRDLIPALAKRLVGRGPRRSDLGEGDFWALRDVSFQVRQGEALGIIGPNGAGKSTLLKILARIIRPNRGSVQVNGRLRALIEVAAGFHPDLTGRENIYLNGSILGMKKREIDRKFDEIVEFSGIADALDTPVKRYSSGMHARLGFAVAAHLDPEILVVDEVLAVGDAEFQKRCLGKMSDVAGKGRTVLFVSHNMHAVRALCQKAVLLDRGRVVEYGDAPSVVNKYLKVVSTSVTDRVWDDAATAPGNEWIRLHRVRIVRDDGGDPAQLTLDSPFAVEFCYWNLRPDTRLNLSVVFNTSDGVCAFATTTVEEPAWHGRPFPAGLFRSVCRVPGRLLNEGTYRLTVHLAKDMSKAVWTQQDVLAFDVHELDRPGNWFGKHPGAVRPRLEWATELIQKSDA